MKITTEPMNLVRFFTLVLVFLSFSCSQNDLEDSFVEASPKFEDGILRFSSTEQFNALVTKFESEGNQLAAVEKWREQFPGFKSVFDEYETAIKLADEGMFKTEEEMMLKYGHAIAIDDRSGFREFTQISSDPVEGALTNHEGLLVIGSKVRKVTWDEYIEADVRYLDALRANHLEEIPVTRIPISRDIIQMDPDLENSRVESLNCSNIAPGTCTRVIHNFFYKPCNGERRLKGQAELLNVGQYGSKVVFVTSAWRPNAWNTGWTQHRRNRLQLRIDYFNNYSWDSQRRKDESRVPHTIPADHVNRYSNSLCEYSFQSFHLCKVENDYSMTLNGATNPCSPAVRETLTGC